MYRQVQLPVFLLSGLVLSSCEAEPAPAGETNCEFKRSNDGSLICVPLEPAPTTSASSTTSGGVPDLGGPSVPDLGGPSVPDLNPTPTTAPTATTGGPAPTATTGGPAPTTTLAPVTTGEPAPTTTGGPAPSETGAVPTVGPAPTDTSAPVPTDTGAVPTEPVPTVTPPQGNSLGSIVVSAGELTRDHSIVSFPFAEHQGKNLVLKDDQGNQIPLQVNPVNGAATFILASLAAGAQATYTIEEVEAAPAAGITAAVEGEHLFVKTPASTVFRWTLVEDNFRGAAARDVRKGYIYPVYTPAGLNVADDYQVDHPHMHGIWSAWTSTTFRGHTVDFWNGYANQGRVDLDTMEGLWSGPVTAGLVANLDHIDITVSPNVVALDEKWVVTVYKTHDDPAPYFVYDIDSVQATASADPLVLEQFHYGGFGYRGSEEWQDPANVEFLTSEGHTRANGDGQNARWCAQFGTVGGQRAGFAAFDHPTNFRHPQGLRIHPTNPYWAYVPVTPLKGGRHTIESGMPYHSLYRIVAFDGNADATMLNALWSDFATPPTVVYTP